MVGDHQTSERVYASLKADILASSRTTDRLNINGLAHKYQTSATPVREALLRLVGEGLVIMPRSGGFVLPQFDTRAARDYYAFSLALALSICRDPLKLDVASLDHSDLRYPIDMLLVCLARKTANEAVVAAVMRLNDQMHPLRLMEEKRLSGLETEIEHLISACLRGDQGHLRRVLRNYHQRRFRNLNKILAALN